MNSGQNFIENKMENGRVNSSRIAILWERNKQRDEHCCCIDLFDLTNICFFANKEPRKCVTIDKRACCKHCYASQQSVSIINPYCLFVLIFSW